MIIITIKPVKFLSQVKATDFSAIWWILFPSVLITYKQNGVKTVTKTMEDIRRIWNKGKEANYRLLF